MTLASLLLRLRVRLLDPINWPLFYAFPRIGQPLASSSAVEDEMLKRTKTRFRSSSLLSLVARSPPVIRALRRAGKRLTAERGEHR